MTRIQNAGRSLNKLSFSLLLLLLNGCGDKKFARIDFDDKRMTSSNVEILISDLRGVDTTGYYSHSRHIDFTRNETIAFNGAIVNEGHLTNFETIESIKGKRVDYYFLTDNKGIYLRVGHENATLKSIQAVNQNGNTLGAKETWDYKRSLFPSGGVLLNRSRSIMAISDGANVKLVDPISGKVLEAEGFPDLKAFEGTELSFVYLSESGSQIFVQDNLGRPVRVYELRGGCAKIDPPGDGWLADAEIGPNGAILILKDVGAGETAVLETGSGKVSKDQCLDPFYFDSKSFRICFFGDIDTDDGLLKIRVWDIGSGKRTNATLHVDLVR